MWSYTLRGNFIEKKLAQVSKGLPEGKNYLLFFYILVCIKRNESKTIPSPY